MAYLRHKRDADARRIPKAAKIAAPIALAATVIPVGLGVAASGGDEESPLVANSVLPQSVMDRTQQLSRSADRAEAARAALEERQARQQAAKERREAREAREARQERREAREARQEAREARQATAQAVSQADTKLWTTTDLNLWTASSGGEDVDLLEEGKKVLVTGREADGRTEVVIDEESRWVTSGYLDDEKPQPEEVSPEGDGGDGGGDMDATCDNGTSVPSGVSPNIEKVHEAVCANFPEITTYGTFRSDGEHSQGLAIDIMVSGDRGYEVAEFVKSHYSELGVNYIIYSQQIWSVDRSSEGWRGMEDRGSSTANHYDHVHVTTY